VTPFRALQRLGLPAAVAAIAAAAALLATCLPSSAADGHYVACGSGITLPRSVKIADGVDPALVRAAMAEWNAFWGVVFAETTGPADVDVMASPATFVEMPCTSSHAVVHVGQDVDLSYWLTHEFGHTLGLADHIRAGDPPARYINPGHCPEDAYDGIMSYCTPRSRWFGAGDTQMMQTLYPRVRYAPPVATPVGPPAVAAVPAKPTVAAITTPASVVDPAPAVPPAIRTPDLAPAPGETTAEKPHLAAAPGVPWYFESVAAGARTSGWQVSALGLIAVLAVGLLIGRASASPTTIRRYVMAGGLRLHRTRPWARAVTLTSGVAARHLARAAFARLYLAGREALPLMRQFANDALKSWARSFEVSAIAGKCFVVPAGGPEEQPAVIIDLAERRAARRLFDAAS